MHQSRAKQTFPVSVSLPPDVRKISLGHSWTSPMCLSSSQISPSLSHPNLVSSSTNTHKPSSSSTYTHKTSSSKMKPHPKQLSTTNNPTDLSNQPQLTFTYPPSASSLPPPQPHIPSLLSHNLLSILPLPLETIFKSCSGMLTGFVPVVLNLYNFFF